LLYKQFIGKKVCQGLCYEQNRTEHSFEIRNSLNSIGLASKFSIASFLVFGIISAAIAQVNVASITSTSDAFIGNGSAIVTINLISAPGPSETISLSSSSSAISLPPTAVVPVGASSVQVTAVVTAQGNQISQGQIRAEDPTGLAVAENVCLIPSQSLLALAAPAVDSAYGGNIVRIPTQPDGIPSARTLELVVVRQNSDGTGFTTLSPVTDTAYVNPTSTDPNKPISHYQYALQYVVNGTVLVQSPWSTTVNSQTSGSYISLGTVPSSVSGVAYLPSSSMGEMLIFNNQSLYASAISHPSQGGGNPSSLGSYLVLDSATMPSGLLTIYRAISGPGEPPMISIPYSIKSTASIRELDSSQLTEAQSGNWPTFQINVPSGQSELDLVISRDASGPNSPVRTIKFINPNSLGISQNGQTINVAWDMKTDQGQYLGNYNDSYTATPEYKPNPGTPISGPPMDSSWIWAAPDVLVLQDRFQYFQDTQGLWQPEANYIESIFVPFKNYVAEKGLNLVFLIAGESRTLKESTMKIIDKYMAYNATVFYANCHGVVTPPGKPTTPPWSVFAGNYYFGPGPASLYRKYYSATHFFSLADQNLHNYYVAILNCCNSLGLNPNNSKLEYSYDSTESRYFSWFNGFKLVQDPYEFGAGPYCFGWRSSVPQPIANNGSVSAFGIWMQKFFNYSMQGYTFGYAKIQADYWLQLYGLYDTLQDDNGHQFFYLRPDGTSPTNIFGSGPEESIYDDNSNDGTTLP